MLFPTEGAGDYYVARVCLLLIIIYPALLRAPPPLPEPGLWLPDIGALYPVAPGFPEDWYILLCIFEPGVIIVFGGKSWPLAVDPWLLTFGVYF